LDEKVAMRLLMSSINRGTQEEEDRKGESAHSSTSEMPIEEKRIASHRVPHAPRVWL
jgi:hypothetical protein